MEYTVCERVTLAWGARGGLVWAGGGALRLMRDDFYGALQDVSHRMQRRAATDYGLKVLSTRTLCWYRMCDSLFTQDMFILAGSRTCGRTPTWPRTRPSADCGTSWH